MKNICNALFLSLNLTVVMAQNGAISGVISDNNGQILPFATVILKEKNVGKVADTEGSYFFDKLDFTTYTLSVSVIGFNKLEQKVTISKTNNPLIINLKLTPNDEQLPEVVVTGTMKSMPLSFL
jgi:CarboxypepD_reg-like domain